jgi:hypothetical protein
MHYNTYRFEAGAVPVKLIYLSNNFIMNNLNKLSRAEMKNVTGGMLQTYNCTITYANCSTITGVSGGSSFQNATDNLTTNILNHPGVYGSPSSWSCQDNNA